MAVWTDAQKIEYRKIHPVTMPVQQLRHNHAHGDIQSYFDAICNSDHANYKGMVTVAARRAGGEMHRIASVPAAQIGEWAKAMHVSTHMDYYYSKAQQSTSHATWGAEHTFAYNAVYVDIDAHGTATDSEDQKRTTQLLTALLPSEDIPSPNIVEYSGRGIHLVWLIEQVAASLGWMVSAVSTAYATAVQALLRNCGICGYTVDMGYSRNITGLTRIPGTFHTTANVYATFQHLHSSRVDLVKAYDSIPSSLDKHHAPKHSTAAQYVGQQRVDALQKLATLRPILPGERDIYLLYLFCAAQMAGYADDAALELAQTANASLPTPMQSCEVTRNLSSAMRKHYRFRTVTMISALGITTTEQNAIGLHTVVPRDTNRARRARNATKKITRDRMIMRLHLGGLSPTAIARRVAHAYNTVRKTISTYQHNLHALFTSAELRHLMRQRIRAAVCLIIRTHPPVFHFATRHIVCLYPHCQPLQEGTAGKTITLTMPPGS